MSTNTEIEPTPGRNLIVPTDADYAAMSHDDLMTMEMLRVTGLSLMSKELLIGVPHIITRVTYWQPMKDQKGMVSCEATVAGVDFLEKAIARKWVPNVENLTQLRVDPDERVVYNDGGTGIRRQITAILQRLHLIDVGKADDQTGERFDTPWPEWENFAEFRYQSADVGQVPSFSRYTAEDGTEKPFLLNVSRGLYVSQYSNEYTNEGETYYLR